jgi:2-amino-4-hydroxy-6-hydroxymethyldihydropteridine diphosphokinase
MSSGWNKQEKAAPIVVIALGSNLGNSVELIRQAIDRLKYFSSAPLLVSSLWRSTPVDCPPGSSDFVNAVVALQPRPDESPETLLSELQALEKEFGRKPKVILNEPRPLDLDLIAFGSETRKTAELTLPHPRAISRRFVLEPLAEILPNLVLPGHKKTISELLRLLNSPEKLARVGD